jgi:hypothetical protein
LAVRFALAIFQIQAGSVGTFLDLVLTTEIRVASHGGAARHISAFHHHVNAFAHFVTEVIRADVAIFAILRFLGAAEFRIAAIDNAWILAGTVEWLIHTLAIDA